MARGKPTFKARLNRWRQLHIRNCIDALLEFRNQPVATSLTVAVIGIALALPASLNLLVQNGRNLAGTWESARDFSVYLQPGSQLAIASSLATELRDQVSIDTVIIITADEAMDDFRESSGLGEVLDTLDANPLPHTLVVRPTDTATVQELAMLAEELAGAEGDDHITIVSSVIPNGINVRISVEPGVLKAVGKVGAAVGGVAPGGF